MIRFFRDAGRREVIVGASCAAMEVFVMWLKGSIGDGRFRMCKLGRPSAAGLWVEVRAGRRGTTEEL